MMRKVFFLFLLISILIAGCSSDAPDTGTAGTQDTDDDTGSLDDVKSMFTSLMGKNPRYKATYGIDSDIGGQSIDQEMTMYFDRKDRFRTDMTTTVEGQTSTVMIFMLDSKGYMCMDQGGNVFCLEQPDYEQSESQDIVDRMRDDPTTFIPKYDGTVSLAGRTGTCFKVAVEEGSSRVCFSKDGILLLSEITMPDGKVTMTVRSIGSSSPSDFQLPAEPQEIPGMPPGFGQPQ